MKLVSVLTIGICILMVSSAALAERISCKSFNTQAEAQRHYDAKLKSWKALDRDKDGEPCECLKGGSKYGESICKRWRVKSGKNNVV